MRGHHVGLVFGGPIPPVLPPPLLVELFAGYPVGEPPAGGPLEASHGTACPSGGAGQEQAGGAQAGAEQRCQAGGAQGGGRAQARGEAREEKREVSMCCAVIAVCCGGCVRRVVGCMRDEDGCVGEGERGAGSGVCAV